jgi:hypothetical protein
MKRVKYLYDVREDWMRQKDEDRDEIGAIAAEIKSMLRNSSVE